MRYVHLVALIALICGCSGAIESSDTGSNPTAAVDAVRSTESDSTTVSSDVSTSDPVGFAPEVESETSFEPVPLPQIGAAIWLIEDWDKPDVVVRTDGEGTVVETLWVQDFGVVGSFDSGHTLVCDDVDGDGEVDLVDLRFSFEGALRNMYVEMKSVSGQVISEKTWPVNGTNVPAEVHQVCGQSSAGPYFRLTARQWGAALDEAGFTDIAGDHPIDPVWAAGAQWNGVEYWPLNLYQGEFRPEPSDETVLIECELGAIEITDNLPDEARSSLMTVSGC